MLTLRRALLVLTLAAAGCSGVDVRSDYEPATDFAAYRTYAWLPQTPTAQVDELVIGRIQRAVDAALDAKGLRPVSADEADLMVNQSVSVTEKLRVSDPYYSYEPYELYREGTLVIDLVDAETRQLVWRGTGQTRLAELKTPEEREERVRRVVEAILARFPPG